MSSFHCIGQPLSHCHNRSITDTWPKMESGFLAKKLGCCSPEKYKISCSLYHLWPESMSPIHVCNIWLTLHVTVHAANQQWWNQCYFLTLNDKPSISFNCSNTGPKTGSGSRVNIEEANYQCCNKDWKWTEEETKILRFLKMDQRQIRRIFINRNTSKILKNCKFFKYLWSYEDFQRKMKNFGF